MLAIAIDTSQDICTLALGKDTQIIAEYHFRHKMDLLRRIMPNIESMVSDAGLTVQDIEGVVVSLGPGSFTGLRIGVTIAKSLAYVLSKPIVGVGTLDAIARSVAPVEADIICPMIHARKGEVYWAMFDSAAEMRIAEYAVSPIGEVIREASDRGANVYFCGSGATHNAEAIRHAFGNSALTALHWADFARGAALLDIGIKKLNEGFTDNPIALAPLYVKKPTPVVRLEEKEKKRESC